MSSLRGIEEVNIRKVKNGYIVSEVRPPAERAEQWVCESNMRLYDWIHKNFGLELLKEEDEDE